MEYIMGIDQGASKTHVIIGDTNGNIRGFGNSYGACHSSHGLKFALEAVRQAADAAFTQSGICSKQLSVIYAGVTGIDWDYESKLVRDEIFKMFGAEKIVVENDCLIAMRAGTKKNYGAVICAGSGLNCAARAQDGTQFIFGFYIDEEFQGGSAMGRACIRAVIDSEVGMCEPTALTGMVLKYFGFKTVDELLYQKATGKITMQQYLYLPLILEQAANKGDIAAKRILVKFGQQFGRYAVCALKKLNMLDIPADIVISGSIFKCREPELRDGVNSVVSREAPHANVVDAEFEPIVGAYISGISLLHTIDDEVYNSIRSCSDHFGIIRNGG